MAELNRLRDRLDEIVSRRTSERRKEQEALETRMSELARRQLEFASLAKRLFDEIVEPRMKLLEEVFDDVGYRPSERDHFGTVALNRESRLNASVTLEMGIDCDASAENVIVVYRMRIIPVLMQFQRDDELSLPIANVQIDDAAAFADAKVTQCAETYLLLRDDPHYRRDNEVLDPVCGMTVHKAGAAGSLEHDGRIYYFFSSTCRERFSQDPSLFTRT